MRRNSQHEAAYILPFYLPENTETLSNEDSSLERGDDNE